MEGINRRLFDWAFDESPLKKKLRWIGNHNSKELLGKALGEGETERFKATYKLSRLIWEDYSAFGLFPNLFLLREIEEGRYFHEGYRDHSTHAFKVYLLGLYIYENNAIIRDLFENEDKFIYTWTVTSLWHDMGYICENNEVTKFNALWNVIQQKINEKITCPLSCIASIKSFIDSDTETQFYNESGIPHPAISAIAGIDKDKALFRTLEEAGIASGLRTSKNNAIQSIYTVTETSEMISNIPKHKDHGIFSALMLLKLWSMYSNLFAKVAAFIKKSPTHKAIYLLNGAIDEINNIQKKIANRNTNRIVKDAARAIALHNIDRNNMRYDELLGMGVNIKPFYIAKENRSLYTAQPYAYLLKLVDELQDWDREKFGEIDKRTVLSGSEMDIYSWPDKIGVWFKKDEDICKHPEVAGSVFSNMKKKLSDYIDVNVLLQGKTNSQMPKSEDIVKSREEFTNIFYCDAAKALMEHIKTVNRCKKISILLYNRKRDTFGYLYTNGVIDDNKDNDIEKFVRHHYFCNDSLFSEVGTSKITKGFSLISTQVGPLGFLVLEDFSSIEPSTQKELNTNHGDNPVLGDLGLIYGTLIFRTIQRKIHDDANEGIPFSSISNGGGNLVTQINDYIPFGHNSCISVFLDIRGLSCLFNGNRKYEKRALEFIRRFSRIVEEQSRKHYGIITCHFGGGMLITFNQVLREELDMSCFRAICTMYKIRKEFVETLLPLAEELFGKAKSEKINIGMGASAGEAIFTTLGCSTSIVYTGIGNKVGFAKKMENISGRNEVLINHEFSSSEDKIFISDDVHQYCAKRDNGIKLQLINNICVSHSKDLHRFYYLGCENMNSDNCYLLHKDKDNNACQGCIDTAKCPVEYKCKDCIEEE